MSCWKRFEKLEVYVPSDRRLYRSSAPHYHEFGRIQTITQEAIAFLEAESINTIISFNQPGYRDAEVERLKDAGIRYHHFPVEDFTAATLEQLQGAYDVFMGVPEGSGVLVHCGYGHGRTGTAITAIQLQHTNGVNPPESEWSGINHVETEAQMEVLRALKSHTSVAHNPN